MSEFIKPDIVNEEIILDPNRVIMSKTDKFGIFEFANDYFMEISGYEEHELMGKDMYCVQHPDMPKIIFKMMWEKLIKKENFNVVIKNIAKSGKYYWSVSNFSFKADEETGEIIAIYSRRRQATKESIVFFSKLYRTLVLIEKNHNIDASEKYAIGFLEDNNVADFNELMARFYELKSEADLENKINKAKPKPVATIESITDIFSIQLDEKPFEKTISQEPIKEEPIKEEPIKEELATKIENTNLKSVEDNLADTDTKKSFFQKMFGKTEEEIEEERIRKNRNI